MTPQHASRGKQSMQHFMVVLCVRLRCVVACSFYDGTEEARDLPAPYADSTRWTTMPKAKCL